MTSTDAGSAGRFCTPVMPAGFFLPKQKMMVDFRDTFMALLQTAYDKGELKFVGELQHLSCPQRFAAWKAELMRMVWITYGESLSDGKQEAFSLEAMERTVGYLARYASRVAISNERLISLEDGQVSFYYKDYRDNRGRGPMKVKQLPILEFIHRFLQHVRPNGKRASRNYGYLGNNRRKEALASIREQLGTVEELLNDAKPEEDEEESTPDEASADDEANKCPRCGQGQMVFSYPLRRPTVNEIYTARWQDLLEKDAVIKPPPKPNPQLQFW